jgi:hypothetical protein
MLLKTGLGTQKQQVQGNERVNQLDSREYISVRHILFEFEIEKNDSSIFLMTTRRRYFKGFFQFGQIYSQTVEMITGVRRQFKFYYVWHIVLRKGSHVFQNVGEVRNNVTHFNRNVCECLTCEFIIYFETYFYHILDIPMSGAAAKKS